MKISVITICYNSAMYIEQTIKSVISQSYKEGEYIIVDGGSTDGTLEIIKKYDDQIDRWISEPDEGIADAMNKGLAMSSGDYVIFLHSDDYFVNENVLSNAVSHLSGACEIFLFGIFLSGERGKVLARPRGFNWWMYLKTGVYHQSAICSRSLFDRIGCFDTGFRIVMDYDFFLRAYLAGVKADIIPMPLSVMRLVGVSSQLDLPSLRERFGEEKQAHIKNCSSPFLRLFYMIYWCFYPLYRQLRR